MQIKCEFSSINIPNESRYALVAARYVVEIATMMGFMESELQSIERAITQTVGALITYSFEPREKATLQITCERIPEGLKVVVKDKGLPFDSSVVIPAGIASDSEFEKRITAITDLMDEVRPENLGKNGKQKVLIIPKL